MSRNQEAAAAASITDVAQKDPGLALNRSLADFYNTVVVSFLNSLEKNKRSERRAKGS